MSLSPCGSHFFRLRTGAFDCFEQSRRGPIRGSESNRRFREGSGNLVGDHRRAAAERVFPVGKYDFCLTDLNAAAGSEFYRLIEGQSVIQRAVGRTEILNKVVVT